MFDDLCWYLINEQLKAVLYLTKSFTVEMLYLYNVYDAYKQFAILLCVLLANSNHKEPSTHIQLELLLDFLGGRFGASEIRC